MSCVSEEPGEGELQIELDHMLVTMHQISDKCAKSIATD